MIVRGAALVSAAIAVTLVACGDDGDAEPTATFGQPDSPSQPTYHSELGFSIDYPADWKVEVISIAGEDVNETAWLMDPTYAQARDEALEANDGRPGEFVPPAGSSKIEVVAPLDRPFDVDYFANFCETSVEAPEWSTGSLIASPGTLAQARTVSCQVQPADSEENSPFIQWVELSDNGTLRVTAGLVAPSDADIQTAAAILASVSFDEAP